MDIERRTATASYQDSLRIRLDFAIVEKREKSSPVVKDWLSPIGKAVLKNIIVFFTQLCRFQNVVDGDNLKTNALKQRIKIPLPV